MLAAILNDELVELFLVTDVLKTDYKNFCQLLEDTFFKKLDVYSIHSFTDHDIYAGQCFIACIQSTDWLASKGFKHHCMIT